MAPLLFGTAEYFVEELHKQISQQAQFQEDTVNGNVSINYFVLIIPCLVLLFMPSRFPEPSMLRPYKYIEERSSMYYYRVWGGGASSDKMNNKDKLFLNKQNNLLIRFH